MGNRTTRFTIKDVRCFKGEQSIDIRPITLLVGENSTGKSTVLGCYHALNDAINNKIDFNIAPYRLGTFDDIVRQERNTNNEFSLGMTYQVYNQSIDYKLVVTKSMIEPTINKAVITFSSGGSITFIPGLHHLFNSKDKKKRHTVKFSSIIEMKKDDFIISLPLAHDALQNSINMAFLNILAVDKQRSSKRSLALKKFLIQKLKFLDKGFDPAHISISFMYLMHLANSNIESMAPMRSKPQRVYDPSNETLTPDGGDTPMLMRKLLHESSEEWKLLHKQLTNFGKKSGMFNGVKIKKFSNNIGDPFQIYIKIGGQYTNIMNVGYGVSQLLPILVRIINNSSMFQFLLQQPEVHLHPRAQAALGTLLVELAKDGKGQNFIVETHSDFIIDRICTEIREGKISPENVSLVYHEMKTGYVQLHNITFDKMGNVENAPDGYRDFFMHEINKVLGL